MSGRSKLYKLLRYSNVVMIFTVNPLYWKVFPFYRHVVDEWDLSYTEMGFLFLTIRWWIDDGRW